MKKTEKAELLKGKPLNLAKAVDYRSGSVVSKALLDKKAGSLTLFAFDHGQGLSEHTSPYDAVVQMLDGQAEITIGGKPILAAAGDLVIMPAGIPHALKAVTRFKMLLTMIWDKGAQAG
jgi:quercetin dioxygenase-like cupin family protein